MYRQIAAQTQTAERHVHQLNTVDARFQEVARVVAEIKADNDEFRSQLAALHEQADAQQKKVAYVVEIMKKKEEWWNGWKAKES